MSYELRLDLRGTGYCDGDETLHGDWLNARTSGLDTWHKDCETRRKVAEAWLRTTDAKTELSPSPNLPSLRVTCSGKQTVSGLGRLRRARLDTLEIRDCELPALEQVGLSRLSVQHLVLRNIRAPILNFMWEPGHSPWKIDVIGGTAHTVFAYPGNRVHVAGIRLFESSEVERGLWDDVHMGFRLHPDSGSCDFPNSALSRWRSFVGEWDLHAVEMGLHSPGDKSKLLQGMNFQDSGELFRAAVGIVKPMEFEHEADWSADPDEIRRRPPNLQADDTVYAMVRIGADWIRAPTFECFVGNAIQIAYQGKAIRAGMTRKQLKAILGRPSFEKGAILAWPGSHPFQGGYSYGMFEENPEYTYRAHFDKDGRLDLWATVLEFQSGC